MGESIKKPRHPSRIASAMTLLNADLGILAATVNDDTALDGCTVVAIDMNFACAASEASACVVDCLLLRIGRSERWLDAWSLK